MILRPIAMVACLSATFATTAAAQDAQWLQSRLSTQAETGAAAGAGAGGAGVGITAGGLTIPGLGFVSASALLAAGVTTLIIGSVAVSVTSDPGGGASISTTAVTN